jgi:hypothetical protein
MNANTKTDNKQQCELSPSELDAVTGGLWLDWSDTTTFMGMPAIHLGDPPPGGTRVIGTCPR